MIVLREYEDFYNYRPHRALKHAAPLRQLPDGVTDLVPLEKWDSRFDLGLLGFQAARSYSLIRPLRTGFRRI